MSASAPKRSRTFSLRLKAALLVNVRARISSARALPSCTSHRMRSAITDVFPAPAPATRNRGVRGWVMARCCSGVGMKARSDIGLGLSARRLDRAQPVEGAHPAVGVHGRLELFGQDPVGNG